MPPETITIQCYQQNSVKLRQFLACSHLLLYTLAQTRLCQGQEAIRDIISPGSRDHEAQLSGSNRKMANESVAQV